MLKEDEEKEEKRERGEGSNLKNQKINSGEVKKIILREKGGGRWRRKEVGWKVRRRKEGTMLQVAVTGAPYLHLSP